MRNERTRRGNKILAAAVGAAGVMGLTAAAQAAAVNWAGTATNFNTGSSWAGGTAPGTSDTATFTASSYICQPELTGNMSISALRATGASGAAVTLTSNSASNVLTLGSTGTGSASAVSLDTNYPNSVTIWANLLLGANAGTTQRITNSGNTNATVTIRGVISGGDATSTLFMQSYGGSTTRYVELTNAANTFASIPQIVGYVKASNLNSAGSPGSLGTAGTIKLGSGGTSGVLLYTGTGETTDRVLDFANNSNNVILRPLGSATLTFTKDVTVSGTGTHTLFLAPEYTDSTTYATLELAGIIPDGSGATDVYLNDGAEIGLVKLTNANNSFSGGVRIRKGILEVAGIGNTGGVKSYLGTSGTIQLGDTSIGTGTLRYTGTGETSNKTIKFGQTSNSGIGTIEVTNSAATLTFSGTVDSGTSTTAATLKLAGAGNGVLQGAIGNTSGTGGVVSIDKSAGAGTWTLSGNNTYSGTTNVSQGTLLINGTNSGTGAVTVGASGKLGGTGSIGGAVTVNGGKLSPGASIQSLSSAAVTLNNNSTFEVELNSQVATSGGADLMVANGNLTIDNSDTNPGAAVVPAVVKLTMTDIAGTPTPGNWGAGTTFTLINYSGTWNGGLLTYGTEVLSDEEQFTAAGTLWKISYNDTTGGLNFTSDQVNAKFVNISVVPEPGSAAALLAPGALMVIRRRKRD
ncbi:MAG: autotransporter-associated beta strand repeat-containing protein [Planctomycetes bacterium]|nr:autotransporter-associated beta strand repeat-containing protein [Planctomycetota bacterium]